MFEYRQAAEVREAFARHGCRFLFLGKSQAHHGFQPAVKNEPARQRYRDTQAGAYQLRAHADAA